MIHLLESKQKLKKLTLFKWKRLSWNPCCNSGLV